MRLKLINNKLSKCLNFTNWFDLFCSSQMAFDSLIVYFIDFVN